MATTNDDSPPLPTLGWVDDTQFTPLNNLTLQSFMDFPVRSWVDDFMPTKRKHYTNLKCLLPSGRIVPGLVPIVKEFDINWGHDWRCSIWEDERRSFRVETVVEQEGLLQAFDIDPTPTPSYSPPPRVVHGQMRTAIQYDGWTDDTYLHVIPGGREGVRVDITLHTIQQLDGVVYNMEVQTTTSRQGVPPRVPLASTEDVRICT